MRQVKYIFLIIVSAWLMGSCNKQIQSDQANPNNPASVPPNLILGTLLTDMSGTGTAGRLAVTGSSEGRKFTGMERIAGTNCTIAAIMITMIIISIPGRMAPFDSYLVLKNVVQMEKEEGFYAALCGGKISRSGLDALSVLIITTT